MASRVDASSPAAVMPAFERLWFDHAGVACRTSRGVVTRREFLARADALSWRLPGNRAGLLTCTETLNFALGLCALLRAGRDILLPPNLQSETLADPVFSGAFTLDDAFVEDCQPAPALTPAPLDPDLRVTLFTSGSTGQPRRIEKRLRQLSVEADILEACFGERIGAAEVAASVPHFHIYGMLFRVIWPLAHGRAFHVEAQPGSHPEDAQHVLVSSPAYLGRIEPARLADKAPRVVFSSGGRLPAPRARALAAACAVPLIEVYGSTETGGIAWREWHPDCDECWIPFEGVQLDFRRDNMLHVRSPNTDGQWTCTGDCAIRSAGGAGFMLEGRADGVLKIEDKRISPRALSEALERHAWVAEARLIELGGKRHQLGAVLRLEPEGSEQLLAQGRGKFVQALKAVLSRRFEAVVVPRKWRFVDAFPVNAMGKTTQDALLALFDAEAT